MSFDFDNEEIGRRFAELEKRVDDHEQELSEDKLYAINREREEHKARWHATYNAVMTGCQANPACDDWEPKEIHEHCVEAADRAHGPLGSK